MRVLACSTLHLNRQTQRPSTGVLHSGVRKGAWTQEEDILLRNCIENYGEGKWHQVPFRAGLNRCRKSCRLRWLNYLRPNIKRGNFDPDEVDLIIRLHKLLGNRWSLIAGRLPGRTANDVKNYWNTHLLKKHQHNKKLPIQPQKVSETTLIKPRPRTFSKNSTWLREKSKPTCDIHQSVQKDTDPAPAVDGGVCWWDNSYAGGEISGNGIALSENGVPEEEPPVFPELEENFAGIKGVENRIQLEDESDWNEIFMETEFSNFMSSDILFD